MRLQPYGMLNVNLALSLRHPDRIRGSALSTMLTESGRPKLVNHTAYACAYGRSRTGRRPRMQHNNAGINRQVSKF